MYLIECQSHGVDIESTVDIKSHSAAFAAVDFHRQFHCGGLIVEIMQTQIYAVELNIGKVKSGSRLYAG